MIFMGFCALWAIGLRAAGHLAVAAGLRRVMPGGGLHCRRLSCVYNNVDARAQRCQCGGVLGRDHITLCPACGSEDLRLQPPDMIV